MWLSEGFSDYVAYSAVDVSVRLVAQDLLALVRKGKMPKALPADREFDASRAELGPAYEGAWLVCRLIAQTYGEEKLVELYVALADRTAAPIDVVLRDVLGVTQAQLVADWQRYLNQLAAR